jgi:galactokinase
MARKSGEARARAPGRINWIGEHTDYNGGLVLPAPIDRDTRVSVALRGDRRVTGVSRERGQAAAELDAPPASDWLDYPRGMARVLAAAGWLPASGFELRVESDLPQGAGLSSSAALLAASALALLGASGRQVTPGERPELARLCQRAELEFAGVPCGLMDHYAVLCGRPDAALWLDCTTLETRAVPLPESHAILIVDTGVERSLRAGKYAERRAECARALEQARAGLRRPLASLSELAQDELPRLEGALDPVALRRARHVLTENRRVGELAAAVERGDVAGAGERLYASHASLRDDYEVSWPEADALVADSRSLPGCVGARMTGAGFGGCTLHWIEGARADAAARTLAEAFHARFGRSPRTWRAAPGVPAELVG